MRAARLDFETIARTKCLAVDRPKDTPGSDLARAILSQEMLFHLVHLRMLSQQICDGDHSLIGQAQALISEYTTGPYSTDKLCQRLGIDLGSFESKSLQFLLHDIKAPLTMICVSLGLLKDYPDYNAQGLKSSLDRLKDFEKAITQHFYPEFCPSIPREISKLLNDLFGFLKSFHGNKCRVITHTEINYPVDINEPLVLRVFANLLHNAVDAGANKLAIEASRDPEMPNYICITVANNGAPIPEDVLGRVFEPEFTHGGNKVHGGEGVGLTGCQRNLDQMGGFFGKTLATDPELGGAKFTIYLKITAPHSCGLTPAP